MNSQPEAADNGGPSFDSAGDIPVVKPQSGQPEKATAQSELEEVKREMSSFERSTLRWTRVTFFVVLGTMIFVGLQWSAMRGQLEEMKTSGASATNQLWQAIGNMNWLARTTEENARNEQRAWLGIKQITLSIPLAMGQPMHISVMTLNTGKTPALDAIMVGLRVGPAEAPSQRDLIVHDTAREVVAPNNTESFLPVVTYSDESIRAIQSGIIRAYIKGTIKYRDIFGAFHHTTFCAYYPSGETGANAMHFFNCNTGNSMD